MWAQVMWVKRKDLSFVLNVEYVEQRRVIGSVKSVDQLLVEPVVVLQARDFVLVASRFTTRRCREAGSEIRRALLILDVVSTDAGEVGGKRGE